MTSVACTAPGIRAGGPRGRFQGRPPRYYQSSGTDVRGSVSGLLSRLGGLDVPARLVVQGAVAL